jgi:hypothetical protein
VKTIKEVEENYESDLKKLNTKDEDYKRKLKKLKDDYDEDTKDL